MRKLTAVFAGAGIGALLGLLIGMSVSNTVSVVIGGLSSILVILLGIQDKENSELHALRVGAFGSVCALCSLLGIYFRTNDIFSPSIYSQIEQWTKDSVYTVEEAKQFILYERLGFVNGEIKINPNENNNPIRSILYSEETSQSLCDKLDGYKDFSLLEELNAYRLQGGLWASLADSIALNIPADKQKRTLHLVKNCFCNEI